MAAAGEATSESSVSLLDVTYPEAVSSSLLELVSPESELLVPLLDVPLPLLSLELELLLGSEDYEVYCKLTRCSFSN